MKTECLELYAKNIIESKLEGVSFEGIYFKKPGARCNEGTYVFNYKNKYHILYCEKGKRYEGISTSSLDELLWELIDIISFPLAMQYATKEKNGSEDYRKKLFEKEIEYFGLFSQKYKEKKINQINEILNKNPYKDICT